MSELTELHEAISATIKLAMPALQSVEAYAPVSDSTSLPAMSYAIVGIKPGVDAGDGRACIVATFEANILVNASQPQAQLQAVTLASELAVLLRKQFWGIAFVDEAQCIQGFPVQPLAVQWRVQWQQVLWLGNTQWPWPDAPGPIAFAFSPDTGAGKEANYQTPEDFL